MARDTPGPPAGPSPGEYPDAAGQHAADPAEAGHARTMRIVITLLAWPGHQDSPSY